MCSGVGAAAVALGRVNGDVFWRHVAGAMSAVRAFLNVGLCDVGSSDEGAGAAASTGKEADDAGGNEGEEKWKLHAIQHSGPAHGSFLAPSFR